MQVFLAHTTVDDHDVMHPTLGNIGPCRWWRGPNNAKGYGRFLRRTASQWAWEATHGPIPFDTSGRKRLLVCHHCDHPACVEVTHLFVGTNADNIRDAITKGRAPQLGSGQDKAARRPDVRATFSVAQRHRFTRPDERERLAAAREKSFAVMSEQGAPLEARRRASIRAYWDDATRSGERRQREAQRMRTKYVDPEQRAAVTQQLKAALAKRWADYRARHAHPHEQSSAPPE